MLKQLINQLRQLRGIKPGQTQPGGHGDLGADEQMIENLLYDPEGGYYWKQVEVDAGLKARLEDMLPREIEYISRRSSQLATA